MLARKRRNRKNISSQHRQLEKRKRTSKNIIIIEQKQKHRNVSGGSCGRHRRTIEIVRSTCQPPLSWLKPTLQSQYQSKHQTKQICLINQWQWSTTNSTSQLLQHNRQILFHPRTSSSTQVILANRSLPFNGKHYWEIYVPAVYGTSMMFGIATKQQQLSSNTFTNLIGIDQYGWALSHHGLLWHNGHARTYLTESMETLKPILIGLEFDADARTLAYTINNQSMGIAFHSIPTNVAIYPAVSSTSAQSTMLLEHCCRLCTNLRDICLKSLKTLISNENLLSQLLPRHLYEQLIS